MIPVGGGHTKAGQLVGKGAAKAVKIDIAAAPELPQTPEEVNGVFVRRVDSPDEMGENTMIRVWGERRGDRVVAEVLVYQSF